MTYILRVPTEHIRTMGVTVDNKGKIILLYNLKLIKYLVEKKGAELKTITALLKHEVYHIVNEHPLRGADKKYDKWIVLPSGPISLFNVAGDIAINQFIEDLPEGALNVRSFGNEMKREETAEYYYHELEKMADHTPPEMGDLGDADGVLFPREPGDSSDAERDQTLEQQKEQIKKHLPFKRSDFEKQQQQKKESGEYGDDVLPGDHSEWGSEGKIPDEMVKETIKQAVKQAYEKTKYGGHGCGYYPAGL